MAESLFTARRPLLRLWLVAFIVRLVGVAVGLLLFSQYLATADASGVYFPSRAASPPVRDSRSTATIRPLRALRRFIRYGYRC